MPLSPKFASIHPAIYGIRRRELLKHRDRPKGDLIGWAILIMRPEGSVPAILRRTFLSRECFRTVAVLINPVVKRSAVTVAAPPVRKRAMLFHYAL